MSTEPSPSKPDLVVNLPTDTSLRELRFKASVLRGFDEAQRGEGIRHDELKDRLSRWRESSGRQKLFEP